MVLGDHGTLECSLIRDGRVHPGQGMLNLCAGTEDSLRAWMMRRRYVRSEWASALEEAVAVVSLESGTGTLVMDERRKGKTYPRGLLEHTLV
tara:strand:+ start:847 stop:1122 length:276 start_codon:yes stop_codon:yes gene_type:complete